MNRPRLIALLSAFASMRSVALSYFRNAFFIEEAFNIAMREGGMHGNLQLERVDYNSVDGKIAWGAARSVLFSLLQPHYFPIL
ncbi:MAG: hypothetical protein ABIS36_12230 [Chryseolinea sp.]